jgi:hypothetical protein
MATTSTVPTVKAALVTLLTAAIAGTDVQVMHGRTQDSLVKKRRVVVVGAASPYSSEIANIVAGRKQRDERYTVDVLFLVAQPRGKAADAETAAWSMFAVLQDVLADDPSLGGVDGLVWAVLGSVDSDVAMEKEGPVAWISAGVDCYGRLV